MSPAMADQQLKHDTFNQQNDLTFDCEFIVASDDDTESVPILAHKQLLAAVSPVFQTMFYGLLPEVETNSSNGRTQIIVPDLQPHTIRLLLDYVHMANKNQLKITSIQQACGLFVAADKYLILDVKKKCLKFLWMNLLADNVCEIYEMACLLEKPLAAHCLAYICDHTFEVLHNESVEHAQLSTLHTILDQDRLKMDSELQLLIALKSLAARKRLKMGE